MAKRKPIVIFDLDGTLADSLPTALNAANTLRFIFGYKKILQNDPRLRLITGMQLARKLLGLSLPKMLIWLPLVKLLVERRVDSIPLFKGWPTILTKLQKTAKLGLLTSSRESYARRVLSNGTKTEFEYMAFGAGYHRKAIAFERLIEAHQLKKSDIIYIGDEVRDLECCRLIGVKFLAVTWGKDDKKLFKKPDGRILLGFLNKPADLLKFMAEAF